MRFEDIRVGMGAEYKGGTITLLPEGELVRFKDIDKKHRLFEVIGTGGVSDWFTEGELKFFNVFGFPKEIQHAIDYIKTYFGSVSEYKAILRKHEKEPNSWEGNLRGLNGLSIDQLRELLFGQNIEVQDKPSVPEYEQQTNLSQADYMSLIDAALIIGDKQWFDELVAKTKNEGAIS